MLDDETAKLEMEMSIGNRAKAAYNGYLKDFIGTQQEYCWNLFKMAQCTDVSGLQACKYLLDSIVALQNSIEHDITSGQLAAKQLGHDGD